MSYPVDRFYAALTVLAGHGHIKQRLIRAYEDNLEAIEDDELPASLHQAFSDLRESMYRVSPLKGESPVHASVRKMSPEDATECASRVVALFSELLKLREPGSAALPSGALDPNRVPPFLVKSV